MGILDETAFIERLRFFDGQRLFASDLQGVEAFHREMRWLHNRSLHQPGIGQGFAVTGKRDDREVRVGPGYALDALGREIVLTRERVEPVPPVASEPDVRSVFFDLVVSYPGDELLEEAETREGICLPRGVVRLREEPVLCWLRLVRDSAGNLQTVDSTLRDEVQKGLRITLARVEVLSCKLRQDVSLAERRSARPDRQPYIACGQQPVAAADITVVNETVVSITAEVDTSSAGFLTAPCYSVQFRGTRFKQTEPRIWILTYEPSVLAPETGRFQATLMAELFGEIGEDPAVHFADWTVVWMGVE